MTCLSNRHYCFLQGNQIEKLRVSNIDPQKMCFELYTKHMEKVHRSKRGHLNCIPIPLCVKELIISLAPDQSSRYTGFAMVMEK